MHGGLSDHELNLLRGTRLQRFPHDPGAAVFLFKSEITL